MAKQYPEMNERVQGFIQRQKIFFVATAAPGGRVNVSPKGMDTLRVLGKNEVVWLNTTGSANETAAHLLESDRMTIMFCAVEGSPMILRLYGRARSVHPRDAEWTDLARLFPPVPGARQIFVVNVDLVQTSCGAAVPFFDYVGERDELSRWAEKKGEAGLAAYWKDRNRESIDGKPTGIVEE